VFFIRPETKFRVIIQKTNVKPQSSLFLATAF